MSEQMIGLLLGIAGVLAALVCVIFFVGLIALVVALVK